MSILRIHRRRRKDPSPPWGPENAPGFTLLEMLIAMSLMAVVLSMVYAAYTGTFHVARETESQAGIYAMARIAMARIIEDLESVSLSHGAPPSENAAQHAAPIAFRGERKDIEGMPAVSLAFPTLAHLGFSCQGISAPAAAVAYDIVRSEQGPGLVFLRADSPIYGQGPAAGSVSYVLCEGLSGARFVYVDREGREWDRWDSENDHFGGGLPVMVTAELDFINPLSPEAPFRFKSSVVLPVAAGLYGKAREK